MHHCARDVSTRRAFFSKNVNIYTTLLFQLILLHTYYIEKEMHCRTALSPTTASSGVSVKGSASPPVTPTGGSSATNNRRVTKLRPLLLYAFSGKPSQIS